MKFEVGQWYRYKNTYTYKNNIQVVSVTDGTIKYRYGHVSSDLIFEWRTEQATDGLVLVTNIDRLLYV
jgi:hypothetical protein